MTGRSKLILRCFTLLVLSSCQDGDPVQPARSVSHQDNIAAEARIEVEAAQAGRMSRGFEDILLRIEGDVPGFGGLYVDTVSGRPIIYLLPGADAETARHKIEARLRDTPFQGTAPLLSRLNATAGPVVKDARYTFSELVAFQRRTAEALAGKGVLALDADESTNRVRVFIGDMSESDELLGVVTSAGVPSDAVAFERSLPMFAASNLRDYYRPLGGGLQIKNQYSKICSHGFNVDIQFYGYRGFLTAAHCDGSGDATRGNGTVGRKIYQPGYAVWNVIGVVQINPPWNQTSSDCMGTVKCTKADVMYVDGTGSNSTHKKWVLGNTNWGVNDSPGSIGISTHWTDFSIGVAYMGSLVNKIGRTTGGTIGTVVGTCLHQLVDSAGTYPYRVLCSTKVAGASAGGGDSGGPVFFPAVVEGGSPAALGIAFAAGGVYLEPNGPCVDQCILAYSDWFRIESHLNRYLAP